MLYVNRIAKHYGAQEVLKEISFRISREEKIGLIGVNGCGKTTLLRLVAGFEEPSEGNIIREPSLRLGFVAQYLHYEPEDTVEEILLADYRRQQEELREREDELSQADGEKLDQALMRYQQVWDTFQSYGGYDIAQRVESVLDGLGLGGRLKQPVHTLSGGEKNVLSFAKALTVRPNLLLLDEPGNHLDYLGLSWLEKFLKEYAGAVLIVSHNRYLLDRVINRVLEIEKGRLTGYKGNYSTHRLTKLRMLVAQQADYAANQKRLAQLEALVKRFAEIAKTHTDPAWGKRLRARRSQLEREKRNAVERPELEKRTLSIEMTGTETKSDIALQVNGYLKAYGDNILFKNTEFEIRCGERVALVGPNGSGKTTFLRDVVEHGDWDSRILRVGPSLTVGYCAQNQELLDPASTILEEFLSLGPANKREVHTLLGRFLFSWDDLDKSIGSLSGGEKNRLQLARLMLEKANFLILDEPTNHMDIASKEAIEESLSDFDGTILAVSHDRYFLDKVATSVVEIRDNHFHRFDGNFSEFWARKNWIPVTMTGRVSTRAKQYRKARMSGRTPSPNAGGVDKAKKDRHREQIESRIERLEQEKFEVERQTADAFLKKDHIKGRALSNTLQRLERQVNRLYQEWENLE